MPDTQLPAIHTPPQSPQYPNMGRSGGFNKSASSPVLGKKSPLGASQQKRIKQMEERSQSFIERQLKHSSLEPRRNMSLLQREVVNKGRASDDVEFFGSKGKEGFRNYLEKKYGSVVCGWRALDRDKSGRLSFAEFCMACRAMGYHGNLKKLWKELDVNSSNAISLMEIDSDVGHYVGTFKLALLNKYGDLLSGWRKCIDINKNGRIEEKEISHAVSVLGLDLDPGKLFKMLTSPTSPQAGLTLQEFDPDSWTKWISGDHSDLMIGDSPEFLEDLPALEGQDMPANVSDKKHGGGQQMRNILTKEAQDERKQILEKIEKHKCGLHNPDGFRQALILRCGSLLGAWREALDLDGNGRLTFGEFCLAVNRLGFHGDVRGLWHQLTGSKDDKTFLLFKHFDPTTDSMLSELREKLSKEYDNMLMAWLKGLDTRGTGLVTQQQFVDCCKNVGFSGDAAKLFKLMKPDAGRTLMTIRDFDTRAFNALGRGDFRMLSEPGQGYIGKSPLQMTFHERSEAGFFYQIRRAAEASRRTEFAKACRTQVPDFVIDTREEFEDLCIRKYGSMISAWRQCLDEDANGKLTFGELCNALRRLGYAGDFKALFKQYDKEKKGTISLRDLDPEAEEMVSCFLKLLGERFGTLDIAWRDGFHQDPHGTITKQEIVEACNLLGYPYDPNKLFRCLQPNAGKILLTIWDLDPECSRKRQRGDHAIIYSEPKSLTAHPQERKPLWDANASTSSVRTNSTAITSKSYHSYSGPTPQQQLKTALKVAYGSTVAAWRTQLDPHLQGTCGFGNFMLVMEDCAFAGPVKSLWDDLRGESTTITFKDMDEDSARILDNFRSQLVEKFGSILQAWHEGLDSDSAGRLDEEHFIKALQSCGIVVKSPKKVFKMLLARHGQRSIVLEDLQALLIGIVPNERVEVWAPLSKSRAATAENTRRPEELQDDVYEGRQQLSYGSELSPKDHAQRVVEEHHGADFLIKTLDDFKRMLVRKYGSLFSAWRHGLDVDQNGVVTQSDFASACRYLGVKAVHKLWTELDANRNGQISLYEVDPEVAEPFAQLENLMIEKYGSTKKAWAATFNKDKSLRCDQLKFAASLNELGFVGDADRFFKLLKPEPGRPYLAYEDLWLNLDMNDFRKPGEEPPGSPLGVSSPLASVSRSASPTAAERRSGPIKNESNEDGE
eukprot:TRINITY_DN108721_c0_g1_i1.p1 TRINITY_DN108721_c0_g1~~TRINITY_DN108721_c0_g1_i1.p1  ORF type:complete len:1204 (+),score=286.18 TRINITY_DN108721_c0_g1_i1:87-3614(+)